VRPGYLNRSVTLRESPLAFAPLIHLEPRHRVTLQFVELFNALEQAA